MNEIGRGFMLSVGKLTGPDTHTQLRVSWEFLWLKIGTSTVLCAEFQLKLRSHLLDGRGSLLVGW